MESARISKELTPSTSKKLKLSEAESANEEDFDKNWDIEKYRREYESEEHWLLRKQFMEKHKHAYPEDKLVCLAQVFTNMELMGCKYPEETMVLVEELASDIMSDYRNSRVNRLKRTFITATNAAENRFKGRS